MAEPARIVVADSDASMRALVRSLLESDFSSLHYTVIEAETGGEVIIVCTTQPIDVLLLDLGLPDASGLDVLAALAAAGQLPCVIAWGDDPRVLARAAETGAHQVVDKAAGVDRLVEAIQYCLDQRSSPAHLS